MNNESNATPHQAAEPQGIHDFASQPSVEESLAALVADQRSRPALHQAAEPASDFVYRANVAESAEWDDCTGEGAEPAPAEKLRAELLSLGYSDTAVNAMGQSTTMMQRAIDARKFLTAAEPAPSEPLKWHEQDDPQCRDGGAACIDCLCSGGCMAASPAPRAVAEPLAIIPADASQWIASMNLPLRAVPVSGSDATTYANAEGWNAALGRIEDDLRTEHHRLCLRGAHLQQLNTAALATCGRCGYTERSAAPAPTPSLDIPMPANVQAAMRRALLKSVTILPDGAPTPSEDARMLDWLERASADALDESDIWATWPNEYRTLREAIRAAMSADSKGKAR